MRHTWGNRCILASNVYHFKIMKISILHVRVSTIEQKSDRQRVNEKDYDKVIEDKCSGSIPIFEWPGGKQLKKLIEADVVKSISYWQIDRFGRDLRDIINFLHYCIFLRFRTLSPAESGHSVLSYSDTWSRWKRTVLIPFIFTLIFRDRKSVV